jgi:translation initiation factor 1
VAKSKHRIDVSGASKPLASPFAGLAELRAGLPAGPTSAPDPRGNAPSTPPGDPVARAAKLVLRRERKGHGGKLATRIEGLRLNAEESKSIAVEIRRALGCGAAIDGDDIVVQGDQVDRLVVFLEGRGAKKIVVGS